MTVRDILKKREEISTNIGYLYRLLPTPCYPAQEPLCNTIELLTEYAEMLGDLEVKVKEECE